MLLPLLLLPPLLLAYPYLLMLAKPIPMKNAMGLRLLASVVLSAQIFVLRRGASSQPVLAGMQAGLIAGAISTIVYANFCTEDDPMFYGIWYGCGIAISMLIGALSGWRFLRW